MAASVTNRLVSTRLLSRQTVDGQPHYAFAVHGIAEVVLPLASADIQQRHEAGPELERIWASWLTREGLATAAQLAFQAFQHRRFFAADI